MHICRSPHHVYLSSITNIFNEKKKKHFIITYLRMMLIREDLKSRLENPFYKHVKFMHCCFERNLAYEHKQIEVTIKIELLMQDEYHI